MNQYLTCQEAADYLRLKRSTMYAFVHQRKIPYRKHGRRLVFSLADLEAFSNSNQVEILIRPTLPF